MSLTQNRLKELLVYEPDTGIFRHKAGKNAVREGSVAGTIHHTGYRDIRVDGRKYHASRLAWLYVYGTLPTSQIDHRNHDRSDDRIKNLREAGNSQNGANKPRYKNNKCGAKGVHEFFIRGRSTGKWRAQIKKDGRVMHLGLYATIDQAAEAYAKAAKGLHGEFWCAE